MTEEYEADRPINIRSVQQEDALLIGQIYCTSWQEAYKGLLPQSYLDSLSPDRWTIHFTEGTEIGQTGLVAWEAEQPVGIVTFQRGREAERSHWGEIVSIYLLPDCWSRGYGAMLLERALAELVQMGFSKAYLWVLKGNERAIRFYEKHGFFFSGADKEEKIGGQTVTELQYIRDL